MSSQVDVCLLADYTGSMGTFLTAAKKSMRELVPTFSICNNIDRVCILGYGDYSDKHITKWSGWKNADDTAELMQFVDSLAPEGGGDEPEAVKTGLKELMDNIDKPTTVIMLTDAPPHTKFTDSKPSHIEAEKNALGDNFDWCVLSRKLAAVGASVWTILSASDNHTRVVYAYLSKMTKGKTLLLRKRPESNAIGRTIIGSVFARFGHDYNFEEVEECVLSEFDEQSVSHEGDLYRLKHAVCEVAMPKVDDAAKKAVVHCFRTDPAYKQRVYNVFKTIITADMIMSLSYNPLLGTLWREICTDKKNDTRFALMSILSSTIGSMEGKDKVHMQAIIEQSYNREWEIREIIESVGKEALYPALAYIGPALNMTVKDVLALGRSCDARSLKILGSIMQSMIVVDHPIKEDDEATAIRSLPLALQTEDLFSCISALIVHGLMQSKRGAAVMAMLAVYTKNQLLYEKASQFLIQARGTWLDVECPENFSYEFVKFVRRVQDIMEKQGNQLLTDKEKSLLEGTYIIGGWRINGNTRILVETAYSSKKTYRYDWKKVCSTCMQYRSMTLLNEKGICGLCIADGVARARQTLCKDPNKSYMCECSKCQVHYAVELVEALNVVPKCHFCRHSEIAPTIQCVRCTNKFVNCEQENVPNTAWQCAECHNGSAANDAIPVPIKEIITTESLKTIMNAKSIWAIYDEMMNKNIVIPEAEYIYVWNKKPILNRDTVINSLDEWIRKGKSEWGTCLSCLTDLPKQKLQPMCKRRKCDANVCSDCIAMWYGGVKRGCVVNVANLKCAFCRQAPHVSVLNKHNKELRAVHNLPKEWKYDWHYAWCRKCDNIKPCFERNCARDTNWDPESIKNFTCEDCDTIGNDAEIVMKECPKCKVSTVKAYGCNHMECPCGAHWCFECGDQFDEESIYNHMWEEHKTIGLVAGDEEDDYDNG